MIWGSVVFLFFLSNGSQCKAKAAISSCPLPRSVGTLQMKRGPISGRGWWRTEIYNCGRGWNMTSLQPPRYPSDILATERWPLCDARRAFNVCSRPAKSPGGALVPEARHGAASGEVIKMTARPVLLSYLWFFFRGEASPRYKWPAALHIGCLRDPSQGRKKKGKPDQEVPIYERKRDRMIASDMFVVSVITGEKPHVRRFWHICVHASVCVTDYTSEGGSIAESVYKERLC